jgi:hypothetical protein
LGSRHDWKASGKGGATIHVDDACPVGDLLWLRRRRHVRAGRRRPRRGEAWRSNRQSSNGHDPEVLVRRRAAPSHRKQRAAAGLAILVVLGLILLFDFLQDERRVVSEPQAPAPFVSIEVDSGITDLELSRGVRLRFPPPAPEPAPPPTPPPAPPEPVGPPAPPPAEPEPASVAPPAETLPAALAGDSSTSDLAASGTPEPPPASAESAPVPLRPRTIVHPRVPEKVIAKRKIDDAVLLQSLVGPDGRVHEVRVLRSIERCDECTQSAIEAAERFVYEAPVGDQGVWTTPFEIRFSYKR